MNDVVVGHPPIILTYDNWGQIICVADQRAIEVAGMTEHEKHLSADDEERKLEREMSELEDDEKRAKLEIEEEVVKEHWGLQPERPLEWEQGDSDDR